MKRIMALATAAIMMLSGAAVAAPIYATEVLSVTPGVYNRAIPSRLDPTNALGAPDGVFYSMGMGGEIELGFGGSIANSQKVRVYEVTFGGFNRHFEAVDLFSVLNGVATFIGQINNLDAQNGALRFTAGGFDSLLFRDVSLIVRPDSETFDGFDLDAVAVAAVPLPAAALLLLAGVGGIVVVGRRRKAA